MGYGVAQKVFVATTDVVEGPNGERSYIPSSRGEEYFEALAKRRGEVASPKKGGSTDPGSEKGRGDPGAGFGGSDEFRTRNDRRSERELKKTKPLPGSNDSKGASPLKGEERPPSVYKGVSWNKCSGKYE